MSANTAAYLYILPADARRIEEKLSAAVPECCRTAANPSAYRNTDRQSVTGVWRDAGSRLRWFVLRTDTNASRRVFGRLTSGRPRSPANKSWWSSRITSPGEGHGTGHRIFHSPRNRANRPRRGRQKEPPMSNGGAGNPGRSAELVGDIGQRAGASGRRVLTWWYEAVTVGSARRRAMFGCLFTSAEPRTNPQLIGFGWLIKLACRLCIARPSA